MLLPGLCGATSVAHGSGAPCHTIGQPLCHGNGTSFHSLDPDARIDVFLSGPVDDLETFLAPMLGDDASMEFYALDGSLLDVASASGDCSMGVPTPPGPSARRTVDARGCRMRATPRAVTMNERRNP